MTDDIVTRLREQSDEMVMLHGSPNAPDEMLFANTFWFVCQNAADEIERLREKLAYHVRIHNEMFNRLDLWGLVAKFEAEQDSDD